MIKISKKVRRLVAGSLLTASALTCIVPLWGRQNNIQTAKAAQEGQYIYSRVFTGLKENLEKEKTHKELEEKEVMEQIIAREYESLESEIEEYLKKYGENLKQERAVLKIFFEICDILKEENFELNLYKFKTNNKSKY